MTLETFQTLPTMINRALGSLCLAGLIGYSAYHHESIESALSERASLVHQVDFMGATLTFDAKDVGKAVISPDHDFASDQAARDVNSLDARSLVRLLYVGTLPDLCLFSGARPAALEDVATDFRLREMGLVRIVESEDLRQTVAARKDLDPALGAPIKCYQMTMTDRGQDAKSALAFMLGDAFAHAGRRDPGQADKPKTETAAVPAHAASAPERVKAAASDAGQSGAKRVASKTQAGAPRL